MGTQPENPKRIRALDRGLGVIEHLSCAGKSSLADPRAATGLGNATLRRSSRTANLSSSTRGRACGAAVGCDQIPDRFPCCGGVLSTRQVNGRVFISHRRNAIRRLRCCTPCRPPPIDDDIDHRLVGRQLQLADARLAVARRRHPTQGGVSPVREASVVVRVAAWHRVLPCPVTAGNCPGRCRSGKRLARRSAPRRGRHRR